MWATLALAAVLQPVPAQGGALALKNARVTYGILGQERKDTKMLPGDVYVVTFDIEGLTVNNTDGKVLYSMGMKLTDAAGKVQFQKDPQDLEAVNALGGSRLPAFALSDIGLDTKEGQYTLEVTVADRVAKVTQKLERKFVVLKKDFGIVRLTLGNEKDMPVPNIAVPGQTLLVNFALVGFDLDKKTTQPDLNVQMRIIDDKTKQATLTKPFVGDVTNVEKEFKSIVPMQFIIAANRTGNFTIELTATDKISKKSVTEKLALTVVEPK